MLFYRVKFPTDTLWTPATPTSTKREASEALIAEISRYIREVIVKVEIDEQTRQVIREIEEEG